VSREDVHVVPIGDLLEHNTESAECFCDPRVEVVGAALVIIHNSLDGREEEEDQTIAARLEEASDE